MLWPIKRELTIYGTSGPRGVNKNAMALSRLIKSQLTVYGTSRQRGVKNVKTIRKQKKKKNENENENEN